MKKRYSTIKQRILNILESEEENCLSPCEIEKRILKQDGIDSLDYNNSEIVAMLRLALKIHLNYFLKKQIIIRFKIKEDSDWYYKINKNQLNE